MKIKIAKPTPAEIAALKAYDKCCSKIERNPYYAFGEAISECETTCVIKACMPIRLTPNNARS